MGDIFTPALEQWFTTNKPVTQLTERPHESVPDVVHPSRFCVCKRLHALERLKAPPTMAGETSLELRLLWQMGVETQERWYHIMKTIHPVEREVEIRNEYMRGFIDLVIDGNVFVEIKATSRLSHPEAMYQLALYMNAAGVDTGYVLLDHRDGRWHAVEIQNTGMLYEAVEIYGSPIYNWRRYWPQISTPELWDGVKEHQAALDFYKSNPPTATAHRLAEPVKFQCVDKNDAPTCPYWCW